MSVGSKIRHDIIVKNPSHALHAQPQLTRDPRFYWYSVVGKATVGSGRVIDNKYSIKITTNR